MSWCVHNLKALRRTKKPATKTQPFHRVPKRELDSRAEGNLFLNNHSKALRDWHVQQAVSELHPVVTRWLRQPSTDPRSSYFSLSDFWLLPACTAVLLAAEGDVLRCLGSPYNPAAQNIQVHQNGTTCLSWTILCTEEIKTARPHCTAGWYTLD